MGNRSISKFASFFGRRQSTADEINAETVLAPGRESACAGPGASHLPVTVLLYVNNHGGGFKHVDRPHFGRQAPRDGRIGPVGRRIDTLGLLRHHLYLFQQPKRQSPLASARARCPSRCDFGRPPLWPRISAFFGPRGGRTRTK
jgi:hypothetical protein